jgi:hypothetical protein
VKGGLLISAADQRAASSILPQPGSRASPRFGTLFRGSPFARCVPYASAGSQPDFPAAAGGVCNATRVFASAPNHASPLHPGGIKTNFAGSEKKAKGAHCTGGEVGRPSPAAVFSNFRTGGWREDPADEEITGAYRSSKTKDGIRLSSFRIPASTRTQKSRNAYSFPH